MAEGRRGDRGDGTGWGMLAWGKWPRGRGGARREAVGSGPRGEAKAQGLDARSGAEWLGLDWGSALGLGLRMVCTVIQGSRLGGGGGHPSPCPWFFMPTPKVSV